MKGKGKGKSGEWRWQPVQHDRSCGQQSRSGGWEPSSWATFGGSGSSGSALRRDESPAPSQASSRSRAAGDSVVEEEDIGWDPYGDANPPKLAKGKCTSPPAVAGEVQPMRHANFNDRDEVGNIGFFFGNWGKRTQQLGGAHQANIDAQIKKKKNPCQIIGLCECQEETEQLLIGNPAVAVEGKDPRVAGAHQVQYFEERAGHDYLTMRGNEESSNLLGVRSAVADSMELLFWLRKYEGDYKTKGKNKTKYRAYSRTLIGQINLKNNVGFMGKEIRVAVCHLHIMVANKDAGFRRQNDQYWPFLAAQINKFNVQVLMGDFNVSLFKVVPELRSRGIPAQMASWFPWMGKTDEWPMADTCGISMCVPAAVTPTYTTNVFHDHMWKLDYLEENAGPGQNMKSFLPKAQDITEKLQDTFGAAVADEVSAVADRGEKGKGKGKNKGHTQPSYRVCLTVKQKTLNIDTWLCKNQNLKGSHFPLAAFTNNTGRRSEERYIARSNRRKW